MYIVFFPRNFFLGLSRDLYRTLSAVTIDSGSTTNSWVWKTQLRLTTYVKVEGGWTCKIQWHLLSQTWVMSCSELKTVCNTQSTTAPRNKGSQYWRKETQRCIFIFHFGAGSLVPSPAFIIPAVLTESGHSSCVWPCICRCCRGQDSVEPCRDTLLGSFQLQSART